MFGLQICYKNDVTCMSTSVARHINIYMLHAKYTLFLIMVKQRGGGGGGRERDFCEVGNAFVRTYPYKC